MKKRERMCVGDEQTDEELIYSGTFIVALLWKNQKTQLGPVFLYYSYLFLQIWAGFVLFSAKLGERWCRRLQTSGPLSAPTGPVKN